MDVPDVPKGLEGIWDHFCDISKSRGHGMEGPLSITYPDIAAYCALLSVRFAPWEVSVLKSLDTIFLTASNASDQDIGEAFKAEMEELAKMQEP